MNRYTKFILISLVCIIANAFAKNAPVTVDCVDECTAGSSASITYTMEPLSDNYPLNNFALRAVLPVNSTIASSTMCTISNDGNEIAVAGLITNDNKYIRPWGHLIETAVIFNNFYSRVNPVSEIPKGVTLSFSCLDYQNHPLSTDESFNEGTLNVIDPSSITPIQADSYTAKGFPLITPANVQSAVLSPKPNYQYLSGKLEIVLTLLPVRIHQYDNIRIHIPSDLYFWDSYRTPSCSYMGSPMEYYIEENYLSLIAPTDISDNEGQVVIICDYNGGDINVMENDTTITKYYPGLPAASLFNNSDIITNITVTPFGMDNLRLSSEITLLKTIVPIPGVGVTLSANNYYVNAPKPTIIISFPSFSAFVPAEVGKISLTIPTLTVDSAAKASCVAGFNIAEAKSANLQGTTTYTQKDGKTLLEFVPSNTIITDAALAPTFRMFCNGLKLATAVHNGGSIDISITETNSEGSIVLSEGKGSVLPLPATRPDPQVVAFEMYFNSTHPLYSDQLNHVVNSVSAGTQIPKNYISIKDHVFVNKEIVTDAYLMSQYDLSMDMGLTAIQDYSHAIVTVEITSTKDKTISDVLTTVNNKKNAIGTALNKAMPSLYVYVDTFSASLETVSIPCYDNNTCGRDCNRKCADGKSCSANEDCASLSCSGKKCQTTEDTNNSIYTSSFIAVTLSVIALFVL